MENCEDEDRFEDSKAYLSDEDEDIFLDPINAPLDSSTEVASETSHVNTPKRPVEAVKSTIVVEESKSSEISAPLFPQSTSPTVQYLANSPEISVETLIDVNPNPDVKLHSTSRRSTLDTWTATPKPETSLMTECDMPSLKLFSPGSPPVPTSSTSVSMQTPPTLFRNSETLELVSPDDDLSGRFSNAPAAILAFDTTEEEFENIILDETPPSNDAVEPSTEALDKGSVKMKKKWWPKKIFNRARSLSEPASRPETAVAVDLAANDMTAADQGPSTRYEKSANDKLVSARMRSKSELPPPIENADEDLEELVLQSYKTSSPNLSSPYFQTSSSNTSGAHDLLAGLSKFDLVAERHRLLQRVQLLSTALVEHLEARELVAQQNHDFKVYIESLLEHAKDVNRAMVKSKRRSRRPV